MNGIDHFRQAEALLRSCQLRDLPPDSVEQYPAREDGVDSIGHALAAARVHATLALAAATALPTVDKYVGDGQHINRWRSTVAHEVVDATIYCGHPDCHLPDGHLSEHGPRPNGFRAWKTLRGTRIGVASDDATIEISLSAGPAHFELILTGPLTREFAEDLLRRADKTEVPF